MYQFKAKGSEIKDYVWVIFQKILPLIIWKKKTELKGAVNFVVVVDFNPIGTNDILNIHKFIINYKY